MTILCLLVIKCYVEIYPLNFFYVLVFCFICVEAHDQYQTVMTQLRHRKGLMMQRNTTSPTKTTYIIIARLTYE